MPLRLSVPGTATSNCCKWILLCPIIREASGDMGNSLQSSVETCASGPVATQVKARCPLEVT